MLECRPFPGGNRHDQAQVSAVIEDHVDRTSNGTIKLYDTSTRSLASCINSISVGALPDMVTFSKAGSRLLLAGLELVGFMSRQHKQC